PAESRFTNTVNVVVTTSLAGVGIRYTLDGSEPVSDSAVYSGPIALTNAVTVRARAFLNGFPVTEIVTKTYRRVYAFDDDGIAAAWRRRYFGEDYATDPRAGAEADPDGDGSSNRQEYLAESDPLDANSGIVVRIRAVPELRFGTIPGKKYRIHRRTSVNDPNPAIVAEITASGAETEYVDRDAGRDANPAFYLIQPVP
ncbi:MAG: chitobiase/beta-hexosaminidase C-terminal domain-containing protein, partial [Verrucomicrobiales bacterium]|nr:chitobiase/beta-hexosaminidase C-terminal domain-containing protein [Verrucomicrobiales bacterium]